jgi:hypothetical protein
MERPMNDEWLPSFAKIIPRPEPTLEDDPLQLSANALGLDGLQAVYRNPSLPLQMRIRAMIAALPFETPKLAVTATVSEQDFTTLLDRRLKRIEEMKAKAIEVTPQVEVKPALPGRRDSEPRSAFGGGEAGVLEHDRLVRSTSQPRDGKGRA